PTDWPPAPGSRDRVVPVFTVVRSAKEEPDCVPAASPCVRRRPSPWPPREATEDRPRSSRRNGKRQDAPPPAPIRQVRAGVNMKDVTAPVPRVLLFATLAGPAPSGSTDASRRCQGCSHPPRHHPDQAALSSDHLLRQ